MAHFIRIFAVWLVMCAAVSAGEFLAGFDDLPVMPGLSALKDAGSVFDSREGEKLKIDFKGNDGALTVRFTLSPRLAASRSR
jgi:hypothetical protein